MHIAQLFPKHNAQLAVMQVAYAALMKNPSLRRQRRQAKLNAVVKDYPGGATQLAADIGTPKSHISAMQHGRRGVGDELAARIEEAAGQPPGWMDQAELSEYELSVLRVIRKEHTAIVLPLSPKPSGGIVRQQSSPNKLKGKDQKEDK
jgi:plasmid maintenance system antidote protein VapI